MHKININSDDQRGKTPDEAAMLILKELQAAGEAHNEICFVVPAVWSWGHDFKLMQFCMLELLRKLAEAVGDKFNFKCSRSEKEGLSIMATRKNVCR